jgi:hypothetical protein
MEYHLKMRKLRSCLSTRKDIVKMMEAVYCDLRLC